MMDQLVQEFPEQLREALQIGQDATLNASNNEIRNVFVTGMGGSAFGADVVAELVADELKVPYLVNKGYDIPAYIDQHTLAVVSSYSGNTEETYNAYQQLLDTSAKITVIASGGKMKALAEEHGHDFIQLPAGKPSPRACLGYSFVQQLYILHKHGLIADTTIEQVRASIDFLEKEQEDIREKAQRIASLLEGKIPCIYTTTRMASVAVRFRQQLNENSKVLAWHHIVPEMNHNELVGWRGDYNNVAVVFFRNKDDNPRNSTRIDINKEIIGKYTNTIIDIWSKGSNLVERAMYFVHLGDWITVELAALRDMDAVEVKAIDYLKGELAKLG